MAVPAFQPPAEQLGPAHIREFIAHCSATRSSPAFKALAGVSFRDVLAEGGGFLMPATPETGRGEGKTARGAVNTRRYNAKSPFAP
jgi:hypothetical protein